MVTEDGTVTDRLQAIADRIDALEEQLEEYPDHAEPEPLLADSELVHKVIHACMESDQLSEDEELQVINDILQNELAE